MIEIYKGSHPHRTTRARRGCLVQWVFTNHRFVNELLIEDTYRGCVFNRRSTQNKEIKQACYPVTRTIQNNTVLESWIPFLSITLSLGVSLLPIILNKVEGYGALRIRTTSICAGIIVMRMYRSMLSWPINMISITFVAKHQRTRPAMISLQPACKIFNRTLVNVMLFV